MIKLKQILLEQILLEQSVLTGTEFLRKYGEFGNELAKVIFKKGFPGIGSNLGEGSYWSYAEEGLNMYLGITPEGEEYKEWVQDVIYKKLKPNVKIFIADDMDLNKQELEDIQKNYDGMITAEDPVAGIVIFDPKKSLM
tara:strand:+ start:527 stop:943 length:417 start_codon:yes stop_codon:yes gene_type:complete